MHNPSSTSWTHARRLAAAALALSTTWLAFEWMLARSEAAMLQSHQARWDCWVQHNETLPRCRELVVQGKASEDADFCDAAVAACQASGTYAQVDRDEEALSTWRRRTAVLRLAMLAAAAGGLLGLAVVGVQWLRRRPAKLEA